MRIIDQWVFFVMASTILIPIYAGGPGTSGAMTLMEAPGARPMALGEAFSACEDDISGFGYNPASLQSLKSGQASFFYRTGMADDSYGRFMIGSPIKDSSLGLSVGYFDGGKIDLFDGVSRRSVTVQRDVVVGLGYSTHFESLDVGITGKYLSSQLVEEETATAYAVDAGFQLPLNSRLRFGSAAQNIGTKLAYKKEGDELPRLMRTGIAFLLVPGRSAARFMMDGIYDLNDSRIYPGLGIEKQWGPLAFRAGYNGKKGQDQFSVGSGIFISGFSFDYSFGMVNQLESMHMISLSTRLNSPRMEKISQKPPEPSPFFQADSAVLVVPELKQPVTESRVYIVKDGDTWETIAERVYGNKDLGMSIYHSNEHLSGQSTTLEAGQKIILPF